MVCEKILCNWVVYIPKKQQITRVLVTAHLDRITTKSDASCYYEDGKNTPLETVTRKYEFVTPGLTLS